MAISFSVVFSFLLHILFVNLMVGGSILTLVFQIKGRWKTGYDALAHEIAKTTTVNKSLAVVLGVAPLLLINTLYTVYFYSANALTGLAWILIIPLVAIAFLITYLHKYTWEKFESNKGLHIFIGSCATIIFLSIPLIFLTNVNLMLFPGAWPSIQGFLSALALPNVFPRYFHFLAASLTAASLFAVGYFKRKNFPFEEKLPNLQRSNVLKVLYSIALGATGAQFVIGPLVYVTLPSHGINWTMTITILAGVFAAIPALILLWREISSEDLPIGRHFKGIVIALLITVVFMGSGRHIYRENSLKNHKKAMAEKTAEFQKRSEEARNNPTPNENQNSNPSKVGEQKFKMFCHSCHDINTRLVGPPVKEIQGIYKDNPEGIVTWTKAPGKKRPDYPQMPAIPIADEDIHSIAKYMLEIE